MIRASSISITSQVLNLIAELDEFKGRWDLLGRLAPDKLTSLKRVATIESVGSSTRIEGASYWRSWRRWRKKCWQSPGSVAG